MDDNERIERIIHHIDEILAISEEQFCIAPQKRRAAFRLLKVVGEYLIPLAEHLASLKEAPLIPLFVQLRHQLTHQLFYGFYQDSENQYMRNIYHIEAQHLRELKKQLLSLKETLQSAPLQTRTPSTFPVNGIDYLLIAQAEIAMLIQLIKWSKYSSSTYRSMLEDIKEQLKNEQDLMYASQDCFENAVQAFKDFSKYRNSLNKQKAKEIHHKLTTLVHKHASGKPALFFMNCAEYRKPIAHGMISEIHDEKGNDFIESLVYACSLESFLKHAIVYLESIDGTPTLTQPDYCIDKPILEEKKGELAIEHPTTSSQASSSYSQTMAFITTSNPSTDLSATSARSDTAAAKKRTLDSLETEALQLSAGKKRKQMTGSPSQQEASLTSAQEKEWAPT